jgi:hypothetical protein
MREGEYLLAVGGRNLTASDNVYAFFESKAGKQVVIKVGPNARRLAITRSHSRTGAERVRLAQSRVG